MNLLLDVGVERDRDRVRDRVRNENMDVLVRFEGVLVLLLLLVECEFFRLPPKLKPGRALSRTRIFRGEIRWLFDAAGEVRCLLLVFECSLVLFVLVLLKGL